MGCEAGPEVEPAAPTGGHSQIMVLPSVDLIPLLAPLLKLRPLRKGSSKALKVRSNISPATSRSLPPWLLFGLRAGNPARNGRRCFYPLELLCQEPVARAAKPGRQTT